MTLKIGAGKFYRTRDGRKVGPMRRRDDQDYFPFDINSHVHPHDGDIQRQLWQEDGTGDEGLHIIAEWTGNLDAPNADTTPAEIPLAPTDPYAPLRRVLDAAYDQAANGKGKERHANDKPFTNQPIMEIARMVGPGYQLGQAMKKSQEAGGMIHRGQPDRAKAELLGAINYLAACVMLIDEAAE